MQHNHDEVGQSDIVMLLSGHLIAVNAMTHATVSFAQDVRLQSARKQTFDEESIRFVGHNKEHVANAYDASATVYDQSNHSLDRPQTFEGCTLTIKSAFTTTVSIRSRQSFEAANELGPVSKAKDPTTQSAHEYNETDGGVWNMTLEHLWKPEAYRLRLDPGS